MYRTLSVLIVLVGLFLVPVAAGAQAQDPANQEQMQMMQGHGMGGGMDMAAGDACPGHGGMAMKGGRGRTYGMIGFDAMHQLDLTPDQLAKIRKIELDLRKQLWALKGKTFDDRSQLYDLYSADRPDSKKIGAAYARLFDTRRQMIEARIEAQNRAGDVLTKDQLAKLRQMKLRHRGGDCPMCDEDDEQ